MSEFKEKCSDILMGGSIGAAAGGSIGAAIGMLGGPVTSAIGAKIGGAVGTLAAIFWEEVWCMAMIEVFDVVGAMGTGEVVFE